MSDLIFYILNYTRKFRICQKLTQRLCNQSLNRSKRAKNGTFPNLTALR